MPELKKGFSRSLANPERKSSMPHARLPNNPRQPGMRLESDQCEDRPIPKLLPWRPLLLLHFGFCPCEIDLARHPPAFGSCLFAGFERREAKTFGKRLFNLLLTGERRGVKRECLQVLFCSVGAVIAEFRGNVAR
jgi:hypothetical protein